MDFVDQQPRYKRYLRSRYALVLEAAESLEDMLPVFDDAVAMHVVLPRETVARVLAAALRAAEGELADADAADAGAAARRVAARRAVLLTLGGGW